MGFKMSLDNVNTDLEEKAKRINSTYLLGRFDEFYQEDNALRQYFEPGADSNGGFESTLDQLNTLECRYSKLLEWMIKKEGEMPNIWVGDRAKDKTHLNFLLEPGIASELLDLGLSEEVRPFYRYIPEDLGEKMSKLYDKHKERLTDESLGVLTGLIEEVLDGTYGYLNSLKQNSTKEKSI